MIESQLIKQVFAGQLPQQDDANEAAVVSLIAANFMTNRKLWGLEDAARADDAGHCQIAEVKMQIDRENQNRSDQIERVDLLLSEILGVNEKTTTARFYSESPGMIVDRLAILNIKTSMLSEIIPLMSEGSAVRDEYSLRLEYLTEYSRKLFCFLDNYMSEIRSAKAYFMVQRPTKVYNDQRLKLYLSNIRNA